MDIKELRGLMEAYSEVYVSQEELDEAEGSYGETPKAYSAASKTKMTAKRKPFLKAMLRRTNPANRKDAYASPRKGMTASDREEARAGAAYGSPRGHDYPSQGPGGVTKSAKKLRKQKAMGEIGEQFDIFDVVLEFLCVEGYAETLEEAEWMMANQLNKEDIANILEVLDTPEKAQEYAKKNVKSMLGAFAKGVLNKDISQLKTIEKRKRGAELGKRKAERKAAEEN
jgi:hypothetical protein